MGDFALVTEGVSDHAVLKNVLIGYYKGRGREPIINFDFPEPHAAVHTGGWTLVLQYLRAKRFRQAFQTNQYVIMQVDTDVAEEPGFDVPKQGADGPILLETFISNVIVRLKDEIGEEDCQTYGDRFIFAIGVEQIECWVLPLWFHDAKGSQIANCTARLGSCPQLRDGLDAKHYPWITANRKESLSYDFASRDYRKRAMLLSEGKKSPGLAAFLRELAVRNIAAVE